MWIELVKFLETRSGLYAILILSLALKLLLYLPGGVINPDGVLYLEWARDIALGHFEKVLSEATLPLYPIIIGLIHAMGLDLVWAGQFVSILGMTLFLIPLYLLTKDLFGQKAAFWACLLAAIAPIPNKWALGIVRSPFYLCFLFWGMYLSQRAIMEGKVHLFLIAGLCGVLAVMFRIEGIVFFPSFVVFLLIIGIFGGGQLRQSSLKGLAVLLGLPLALLLAGYLLFGQQFWSITRLIQVIAWGKEFLAGSFFERYWEIYEHLRVLESKAYFPGGKQNFAEIARHLMPLIYLFGLFKTFVKVVFPPFVVPLGWSFRHKWSAKHLWVVSFIGLYLFMIYLSLLKRDFIEYRFLLAPAILLYPWIGDGINNLLERPKRPKLTRMLVGAMVAILFFTALAKNFYYVKKRDHSITEAAAWINAHSEWSSKKVVTTDPRVALHANQFHWLTYPLDLKKPEMNLKNLYAFARSVGADLLILKLKKDQRDILKELPGNTQILASFTGRKYLTIILKVQWTQSSLS